MPKRGQANFDKLFKIRPLVEMLNKRFAQCYQPHQKEAIDESMVKFKGRSSMKQYMRDEPVKRGCKMWMLCDESAYNLKFQIYTGRLATEMSELGLGARVKTFAVGTVNPTRKFLPKLKEDKKMKREDFDSKVSNHDVAFYKWMEKRAVNLISTMHDPSDTTSVNRKEKDGSTTVVACPRELSDYNMSMNFVDNFDCLKGDYGCDRKKTEMEQFTNKDFRRKVYEGLLAKAIVHCSGLSQKGKSVTLSKHKPHVDKQIRLEGRAHQPKQATSRRCAVCSTRAVPVRTVWMCSSCNVPLCLRKGETCFQTFHSQ
ncbi:piggyBac transposable element-derived protein 4-like [Schistocerca piceifrons]|uniref:piggyBac transposable element-derived protein 4-like n=1 Tax=Schistocerca piceifrons TaxID=274613 RepID=UPI001F5E6B9F|nr:piggyBac transposable element-derived protein 4-like [Schistocerca piceifrons]